MQSACWTFSCASAKCSAFKSSFFALAAGMTSLLAATLYMSSMLPQVWSNVVHIDQYQSTLVQVLVLLCMMNLSIICMACSDISVGACASFSSALVSSEKEFHATHEVFLPYPTNADTVSYPVSA